MLMPAMVLVRTTILLYAGYGNVGMCSAEVYPFVYSAG